MKKQMLHESRGAEERDCSQIQEESQRRRKNKIPHDRTTLAVLCDSVLMTACLGIIWPWNPFVQNFADTVCLGI